MASNQPVLKESLLVIPAFEFDLGDVNAFLQYVQENTDNTELDGVKVVITFLGLTNGTQVLKECVAFGNSTSKEQTKVCIEKTLSYCKDLVGTTLTKTYQIAMRIKEILNTHKIDPNISLVNLFSYSSPDEALTVQAQPPQTGVVFFKTFKSNTDLDGYSHFFRVQFYLKQQSVTIWIVLDTLVPIGVGSNNELYAVVPNIPIKSEPPDNDPRALHWLSVILDNPDNLLYQSFFFREGGVDLKAIIHPNKKARYPRVCKGEVSIESYPIAVIGNRNTEFNVHVVHKYELINLEAN